MKPINLAIILALGTFAVNGIADTTTSDIDQGTTYDSSQMNENANIQMEEDMSLDEDEEIEDTDIQREEQIEEGQMSDENLRNVYERDNDKTFNEEQSDETLKND